ncbi:PLP-dependent aminotransferase family protein [Microbacterium rhizosphaerae]|uniref:PLP-dependent aminotransferase family protein n=1 Tax=Microbacterium rhizosphaerae TaxID=1678237 RepID=A0ABZ0SI48_9MICO|nr:PLP-dependent aminotransferase family protein [Microbacterium rhizosphaerae]WPR88977.1 PLP-dependent aminotransferase family protein [Microbacterium rhizosphaerae]
MWANSGLDLHLDLDPARKTDSLERGLRDAIRSGLLTPGERMPTSRSLAGDLGISRNSVAEVYGRLTSEGWLEARVGAGTWVAATPRVIAPSAPRARRQTTARLDLRAGIPDATAFPVAAWVAASRRALTAVPTSAFGYGDLRGAPPLREALAAYVSRARGVWASAEAVHVTHGFGEALALVGGALVDRGARTVAVEEYGHALHRDILRAAGLRVVPMRVDAEGADPSALGEAAADAVLLTPAHQFPTGAVLSAGRRAAFVEWARRTGGILIEDDYDGEFRYDRRAVGALQALAPEHVVYAGTASKALTPALGLAWCVLPQSLGGLVADRARLSGAATDVPSQLTLAEFLRHGDYDRAVRSSRAQYRARRERLDDLIGERLTGARLGDAQAGLQSVLELPPGASEQAVTDAAASRSLALEGLGAYFFGDCANRPPTMVIGFGAPPPHLFEDAAAAAVMAVREASRGTA